MPVDQLPVRAGNIGWHEMERVKLKLYFYFYISKLYTVPVVSIVPGG